jgi:4-hydroxy-tetrahydrodipicolinate synthase
MPSSFPREGIIVALTIPLDANGQPMRAALKNHIEWLRSHGIDGVLALGSTAEFMRLDVETRKASLALIAELAAPLPVLANISDIRLQNVVELGHFARALGLPGVAVMTPSFYPVSDADQLAFFERAAQAFGGEMMLYNFPEHTGNRIALETVAAFAERAPLRGFKQSGGEFSYHQELIPLGKAKGFSVFSGADTRLPDSLALGAAGCIGGLVNFVPEYMVAIYNIARRGGEGDIETVRARLLEIRQLIDRLTFPLNVTAGLEARGLETGAPKTLLSAATQELYARIVTELRSGFEHWQLPPAF